MDINKKRLDTFYLLIDTFYINLIKYDMIIVYLFPLIILMKQIIVI